MVHWSKAHQAEEKFKNDITGWSLDELNKFLSENTEQAQHDGQVRDRWYVVEHEIKRRQSDASRGSVAQPNPYLVAL